MEGGEDWDLAAVVRSCCCSRPKPPSSADVGDPPSVSSVSVIRAEERGEELFSKFFPDRFTATTRSRSFQGLEDLYTPFIFNKQQPLNYQPQPLNQKQQAEVCLSSSAAAAVVDPTIVCVPTKAQRPASQTPRSNKRRKKQLKKVVCQVPADGVSSDMWAWRKYGQKPIKGSPYPRGYYRCSSFRGCPARKQVERNRTDPGQLIVTYTSEHNHPIPTRHKFPCSSSTSDSASAAAAADVKTPEDNNNKESTTAQLASSPTTSASMDGEEEEKDEEEEEAMLMVEDMEMIGEDELVFVGDADNNATTTTTTGATSSSLFEDDDGGLDDDSLLFASPWLDNGNNSSATAAAC